jgi:predicted  nucleic acid-binding Zn-ribbon protein
MVENPSGDPASKEDTLRDSIGLLQSISAGVKNLVILDEKLAALARENEKARNDISRLQELVYRLVGKVDEIEKRLSERFAELDKRLAEIDKRIDLKIELAVRTEFDKHTPATRKPKP